MLKGVCFIGTFLEQYQGNKNKKTYTFIAD